VDPKVAAYRIYSHLPAGDELMHVKSRKNKDPQSTNLLVLRGTNLSSAYSVSDYNLPKEVNNARYLIENYPSCDILDLVEKGLTLAYVDRSSTTGGYNTFNFRAAVVELEHRLTIQRDGTSDGKTSKQTTIYF